MNFRHEWKHEISPSDLIVLRQRLRAVAKPDTHSEDGRYDIRSLYFDTWSEATAYLERMANRCAVKSKTAQKGAVELTMEIRLKDDNTDFINALSEMDGVNSAVLVSYNGDYMG